MPLLHTTILLNETVNGLNIKPLGKYVDATLGYGGHTQLIIEKGGLVLGIDQDPEIIAATKQRINSPSLTIVEDNFVYLKDIVKRHNFYPVDGVVFDLGVSSLQLDTKERGFSFHKNAPLDMRMSPTIEKSAKDLVNELDTKSLFAIFTQNAQEEKAWEIAQSIVKHRNIEPITTTTQLTHLITQIKPNVGKIHPATKVFQALRIAVNQELDVLEMVLPTVLDILKPGGRIAIITFHEGEDRIAKRFIDHQKNYINIITSKPITPSTEEVEANPRSRSAKLRIIEKK